MEFLTNLTTAIATVTNDYVTCDRLPDVDERRLFSVEDINDAWHVEVPFVVNADEPFCIRAGVFKGEDVVLSFSSAPDERGIHCLTRWLRAALELDM